ncbi:MAG: sulfatase-like hydrolase/transferase, partial [Victivallales bacterium]|nr:sulfatase-like hydrolase/transferase [Victivallales bacterium]
MPETQRPNVLVLLVDQLNPLFGGWAGDPTGVTPNLDRLAAEGTVFDCAYSVGPVCMPGRCSFISGLYPHQHGYWTNFIDEAFPARLGGFYRDVQAAGYRTGYVGKTHWFNPAWGEHTREHESYFQAIGLDTTVDIPGTYLAAFQGSPYTDHLRSHGMLDTFLRDMALQM